MFKVWALMLMANTTYGAAPSPVLGYYSSEEQCRTAIKQLTSYYVVTEFKAEKSSNNLWGFCVPVEIPLK